MRSGNMPRQECPFDDPDIRMTEYAGNDEFATIYNIAPFFLVIPSSSRDGMSSA